MESDSDVPCAVVLPMTEIDVDNFASLEESSPSDVMQPTTFSLATREPLQSAPPTIANQKVLNVFVVSTYAGGSPPQNAVSIFNLIDDMSQDFRVSGNAWENHHFAILGCGEQVYGKNFNRFAISLQEVLSRKGGYAIFGKPHLSDIDTTERDTAKFIVRLKKYLSAETKCTPVITAKPKKQRKESAEADIEEAAGTEDGAADEMINPRIRQGLTKQGYTLFGTHSGVKLCRWTKSMMRGHGGCYKHTFYGISSLACMEMTPSLACANKCVFCWRHHTNPTAREWRWKHDPPEFVINGALDGHRRMLKVLRGVPGVTEERLREAMQVRHCALSLVGEPIIYPEINKLIQLMHQNEISTFLVTNAQFPDRIRDLPPATQLYVSVDAGDKASLQAIDRPIFEDFWDRYLECIRLLALKKQRTVFRLTLVKNYNVEQIDGYISLVRLGKPEFIEVKGVTYCGDNGEDGISMRNVPYHHEVIDFCKLLLERIGDTYDIACEHEHSCCVLLARKEFKIDGVWHTWINYSKFFELARSGEPFTSMDYLLPTPDWGVYGSAEKGFDPSQIKKKLRHKGPIAGGC
ncbi:hypothetical protein XU18_0367 [Perkinsela sp. CCAP 1560/4]|nr:hypothetical protein XU18_0367 [Perkinsela sp. CCAP 1560/4]|eukprot:KNH09682.1 hypothetical protein XU18_0367 [Perkinsela sp. CCAP 1560/4]